MAIVEVTETALVEASPEQALSFLADARNDTKWKGGFVAAELTNGTAVEIGSVFKLTSKMMGMTNTVQVRLTAYDREAGRIVFETVDGMVKNSLSYQVSAAEQGSVVTLHAVLEAAAPIANMAGRMLRSQIPKDMARLPQFLAETRSA
jgi:carbon monoxide dehydrogenase subunit G